MIEAGCRAFLKLPIKWAHPDNTREPINPRAMRAAAEIDPIAETGWLATTPPMACALSGVCVHKFGLLVQQAECPLYPNAVEKVSKMKLWN
jgi:hypothetical protein